MSYSTDVELLISTLKDDAGRRGVESDISSTNSRYVMGISHRVYVLKLRTTGVNPCTVAEATTDLLDGLLTKGLFDTDVCKMEDGVYLIRGYGDDTIIDAVLISNDNIDLDSIIVKLQHNVKKVTTQIVNIAEQNWRHEV